MKKRILSTSDYQQIIYIASNATNSLTGRAPIDPFYDTVGTSDTTVTVYTGEAKYPLDVSYENPYEDMNMSSLYNSSFDDDWTTFLSVWEKSPLEDGPEATIEGDLPSGRYLIMEVRAVSSLETVEDLLSSTFAENPEDVKILWDI